MNASSHAHCSQCGRDLSHDPEMAEYATTGADLICAAFAQTEPPKSCDCSDEYGPCEEHGDTLIVREGASLHTADELTMIEIDDLVSVGAELSAWGRAEYERLNTLLESERDPVSGTAWFTNPDDADDARDLAYQLESYVADLWVIHDDGYRIVRPRADCPLND